ncbi:MAG: Co2+/Mg2+ efflux protein ApaG [Porticoccaceae bacterium]
MTAADISIKVRTEFLSQESQPQRGKYAFGYHITISNGGTEAAKLISRHWIITDGNGVKQEVKGLGVVGEQPTIEPGGSYSYSSFAVLQTTVGTMEGSYDMHRPDGTRFRVPIDPFLLALPGAVN